MIIVYIILAFIALFVIAVAIRNVFIADELQEEKEEMYKFSVHLDERANKLAADEQTIRKLYKELREELNKQRDGRESATETDETAD